MKSGKNLSRIPGCEEEIFTHNARIRKFNRRSNGWEVMGEGQLRIFYIAESGTFRLLFRDEGTRRIICNMELTSDIVVEAVRPDRSWDWEGYNTVESNPSLEKYSLHFDGPAIPREHQRIGRGIKGELEENDSRRMTLYEGPGILMFYSQFWEVLEPGKMTLVMESHSSSMMLGYYTRSREYRCLIFPTTDYAMYIKNKECFWRARVADSDSVVTRWCGMQFPNENNAQELFFYMTFSMPDSKVIVLEEDEESIETHSAQGRIGFIKRKVF